MRRASAAGLPSFAASAEAFEAELDYVYRTFRRLGARPSEAEELAQDVFLVMWRRWSDYQPGRPLRPWLAGIAHNVARDHFRNHSRRELATAEIEQADERPSPDEQLEAARARQLALRALGSLRDADRSILIRHDLDGVPIREIAEQLSLPLFTAATRLRRARLRFAEMVRRLQPRGRARLALVPGAVLEAEREVGPMPAPARARVRARLGQVGRVRHARPPVPPPPASRWPLAPVAGALVAALVIALPRGAAHPFKAPSARSAPVNRTTTGAQPARRPSAPLRLVASAPARPQERRPVADVPRPIAHWRFEDGPGSMTAADSSGNGHPCLLHALDPNTAWVSGRVGGAIDLDRAGWLECPLPGVRAGVPFDLSISVWMKRLRWSRPEAALFTRQLPSGDNKHLFWFGVRNGRVTLWSRSWQGWISTQPRWGDGWTHLAFVHAGRETRLYVNGLLVEHRRDQRPRGEGLVEGPLTIGATRFSADPLRVRHHFDGLVDEAVVYDRALTDAQVAALARAPEP